VSTSSFLFPDLNVWFALTHTIHPQHSAAKMWAAGLDQGDVVYFCRFTQLGLLRLLTNHSAMGPDLLTHSQAWRVFDQIIAHPGNRMIEEPKGIEPLFRQVTDRKESSTKQWPDGYLAAFAQSAGLILVTFDKALAAKTKCAILLQ
jgi:uncharacterized protein